MEVTVFKRKKKNDIFLLFSGATTAYKFLMLEKRPMRELQYSSQNWFYLIAELHARKKNLPIPENLVIT